MASVDGPSAAVPPVTLQELPGNQAADDETVVPGSSQNPPNDALKHRKQFAKGEDEVARALSEKSGKLTLLELPVDILRLIVQEV